MSANENSLMEDSVGLYDLSSRPATFDIVTWLAVATTCGAKHVRFVTGAWKKKNYTEEQAEARFESICKPAVGLFGIGYSIGEPFGFNVSHMINAALAVYGKAGYINKINYPLAQKDYVTITLRRSRTPGRDSNEREWLAFAKRLSDRGQQALILRDYDEVPLELSDRIRLYAGARMNFFVNNGPAILCILSEIPYLIMRYIGGEDCKMASPVQMAKLGITPGFQYPWANPHQRLSYLADTCENIEQEYAKMPRLDWRKAA